MDSAGNVYIADAGNSRIRKVTTDGMIQTAVGGGNKSEGTALEVRLSSPYGVAIDPQGVLYVVNTFGNSILRIGADGSVTKVAGGSGGFAGDGGPATQASLQLPQEVAFAGGNLYIADTENQRVRKVDTSGMISTVVGNGNFSGDGGPADKATLFQPTDVARDAQGALYIADTYNHRIRKVATDGTITTVAGSGTAGFGGDGGPATEAKLYNPHAVDVDAAGNLYIMDSSNYRVRKVDAGGAIQTIAGSTLGFAGDGGPAAGAKFQTAYGIAVDRRDGSIYVADSFGYRVRRIGPDGNITTVVGTGESGFSGDGGPAAAAQISYSPSIAVDGDGNLYIADASNYRVRKVTTDGMISTVAGSASTSFSGDSGPATMAGLNQPLGVAVDGDGNLYISDKGNNRIRVVTPDGIIHTIAGSGAAGLQGDGGPAGLSGIYNPGGLVVDGDGNVYFASTGSNRIRKLTPGATQTGTLSLVNAASFAEGPVAPDMIVSIYGSGLAASLLTPSTADLPQTLGGTSVEVADRLGVSRNAGLYFVSSGQINAVIPGGTSTGKATIIVRREGAAVSSADVQVQGVNPALFSANASGMGVAAANVLRITADGTQTIEPVAMDSGSTRVAVPINLGPESDKVYLLLYGTGIRGFGNAGNISVKVGGRDVPLLGAAAQSQYPGLDQVNVGPLPRELAGSGPVDVVITVSGHTANTVTVTIQ